MHFDITDTNGVKAEIYIPKGAEHPEWLKAMLRSITDEDTEGARLTCMRFSDEDFNMIIAGLFKLDNDWTNIRGVAQAMPVRILRDRVFHLWGEIKKGSE